MDEELLRRWREELPIETWPIDAPRAEVEQLRKERDHFRTAAERMGYGETGWPRVFAHEQRIAALERKNAALREFAQLVMRRGWYEDVTHADKIFCRGCEVELYPLEAEHRADCPVTKVRAILAQQPEGEA